MNDIIIRPAAKRLLTPEPWRPRICTAFQIYYLGACFAVTLPQRHGHRCKGKDARTTQSFLQSGTIERGPGFHVSAFPPLRRRTAAPLEAPMIGVGGALLFE
jgi:hypothetical protein